MAQQNFTPLQGDAAQPTIEERWDELRSKIKKQWPELTREDLSAIDGDVRKLIALVHQKTGAELSVIEKKIDEIAASSEGLLDRVGRNVKQAVSSTLDHVSQPLSDAYQSTRKSIVAAPAQSAGIAFGAGLLIGLCTASLINDVTYTPPRRNWW